ncbi:Histone-lysine N-methyltransferase SETMAR-like Protein [Tribolium castaneum]|uniref:Histone-lysine N-methyltransferase SETMAR-like Protein n=1 Tax=Tribolium castaneum TaxID=7070 RepID=D6X1F8_TRICA|nr:Histone-lysine N-methyltransferase SETMAR-like Protein [Tribolium castaneum]
MEHIEHRAVIKFLVKQGKTAQNIMSEMESVYGEQCPGKRVNRRRLSPRTACRRRHTRNHKKNRKISSGRSPSEKETAFCINRSIGNYNFENSARPSWHDKSQCKVGATNAYATSKTAPHDGSTLFLELCGEDSKPILDRIVTGDETWVHHFEPESKQDSMQWHKKGTAPPKKFKVSESAGKLMATVFWDTEGVLLLDYKEKGVSITGEYYDRLLEQLKEAIKEKRRGKWTRGVLLLQDNAPVHKSHVAMTALHRFGFQSLVHPPYSPDLAPSDYFLFPNLKKELRGKKFRTDEAVKEAIATHFAGKEKTYLSEGIFKLISRSRKCIELEGDYIEKGH